MRSTQFIKLSCLGLISCLLLGCALSPQLVTIRPKVEVRVQDYGHQRDINVRVEDRRQSAVVGTRGGVYGETSTIEIGNDVQTEMAYTLAAALTRWGFRSTVNGYRGHALEYKLFLDELSYQPDRAVAGKINIQAKIAVEVESGGALYRGEYGASGEMGYVTTPSAGKNEARINQILNLALAEMFADQKLIGFLQQ